MDFSARLTTFIEVRVTGVQGGGVAPVGLSEIVVPSLDHREVIRLPEDWLHERKANRALESALRDAPIDYLFKALPPVGFSEVEPTLRRALSSWAHQLALSGTARLPIGIDEATLDALAPLDNLIRPECRSDLLEIDGRSVPVRFVDEPEVLRFGLPARFLGCGLVQLDGRRHTLAQRVRADH